VGTNLLVGLALAVPLGAPALKPAPKPPAPPTLHGEWAVESFIDDGEPEDCVGMTIEFATNNRLVVRKGGKVDDEGTYSTAPAKDPGELDWVEADGKNRLPGIYRFDGDTLILCVRADPAGTRPTAFDAPPGSDCALIILKRAKKKD
jgi:uncharacterized protein (TIGR03067 family)